MSVYVGRAMQEGKRYAVLRSSPRIVRQTTDTTRTHCRRASPGEKMACLYRGADSSLSPQSSGVVPGTGSIFGRRGIRVVPLGLWFRSVVLDIFRSCRD